MNPHIVGIGGTTRPGSSSERLVREILACAESRGAKITMLGASELAALPHYSPFDPARTPEQIAFVKAIRSADGLVIGSPGYHGGVSGLVKNALDLIEDTRADTRPYLDGLPVGLAVAAAGWQAGGTTLTALRGIVHALRGWPTPLGICVNTVSQEVFDSAGTVVERGVADSIACQVAQIMRMATIVTGERRWAAEIS